MKTMTRKMSLFAAAAGFAALLWITAPSKAAELDAPGKQTASAAGVPSASARRHHQIWPRYRVASWYTSHLRYADALPAGWHDNGSPRPVLLMVGVAY